MATSKTEIANISLSHLGSGKEIDDIETDRSAEANACRRFMDNAIKQTLRDFHWPFATKFADLALVESGPTDEWSYSYRYPSDCLFFRRVLGGSRIDTPFSRVPYKIGQDGSGILIYCDVKDAKCEYTYDDTTVERYPHDFVMTTSFRLAAYIAPRITAGDPFKLGDRALKMYFYEGSKATATAANEQQSDEAPDSELILARDL